MTATSTQAAFDPDGSLLSHFAPRINKTITQVRPAWGRYVTESGAQYTITYRDQLVKVRRMPPEGAHGEDHTEKHYALVAVVTSGRTSRLCGLTVDDDGEPAAWFLSSPLV